MTNPGDIERIATKVVPYYVVGVVEEEPEISSEPPEPDNVDDSYLVRPKRPTWLGFVAAALGLATLVLLIVAIVMSIQGSLVAGTWLSYSTIIVSIAGIITAVVSLILGYQRRWAAFGLAMAILANPLALLTVFRFFGS